MERLVYSRQLEDNETINLHYCQWNPGGIPLLLLHGLADHGFVWQQLGDALGDRYHIIAPDLRGHGNSTKPNSGYSSQDIIDDLRGLMNHLGWPRAHILGHSWMGKVACIWATHHPQDFNSLILVDPFFINKIPRWSKFTFPLFYKILPFLQTMGPFESYQAAEKIAQGLKQYQGWSDCQRSVFKFAMEPRADGTWGSKFTVAARNEIFEDVMVNAGLTEPIDVPTLFIQPDQGLNRSDWQLKPYYQYLSNLQLVSVPGNHWAFLVEPDAFNVAIAQFLTHSP